VLPATTAFLIGGAALGPNGLPQAATAAPGDVVEVSLYYVSPVSPAAGSPRVPQRGADLQGLSMVVCYDCRLHVEESSLRLPPDSIARAIGVDFVAFQADNDPADGDGCSLLFAVLVDADPPFAGTTLPATDRPLKLAVFEAAVSDAAPCGETLALTFCEGVRVRGTVPHKNLYAHDNHSFAALGVDSGVFVDAPRKFLRGDCSSDGRFNVVDAVAMVFAFLGPGPGRPTPRCADACDANDDGRLDVSDPLFFLAYLFARGDAPPPPGVKQPDIDPTADDLGCELGCQP
jgi:hypothetical protein